MRPPPLSADAATHAAAADIEINRPGLTVLLTPRGDSGVKYHLFADCPSQELPVGGPGAVLSGLGLEAVERLIDEGLVVRATQEEMGMAYPCVACMAVSQACRKLEGSRRAARDEMLLGLFLVALGGEDLLARVPDYASLSERRAGGDQAEGQLEDPAVESRATGPAVESRATAPPVSASAPAPAERHLAAVLLTPLADSGVRYHLFADCPGQKLPVGGPGALPSGLGLAAVERLVDEGLLATASGEELRLTEPCADCDAVVEVFLEKGASGLEKGCEEMTTGRFLKSLGGDDLLERLPEHTSLTVRRWVVGRRALVSHWGEHLVEEVQMNLRVESLVMAPDNVLQELRRRAPTLVDVFTRDPERAALFLRPDGSVEYDAAQRALLLPLFYAACPRKHTDPALSRRAARLFVTLRGIGSRGHPLSEGRLRQVAEAVEFMPALRVWVELMTWGGLAGFLEVLRKAVRKDWTGRRLGLLGADEVMFLTTVVACCFDEADVAVPLDAVRTPALEAAQIRLEESGEAMRAGAVSNYLALLARPGLGEGRTGEPMLLGRLVPRIERLGATVPGFSAARAYDKLIHHIACLSDAEGADTWDYMDRLVHLATVLEGLDPGWRGWFGIRNTWSWAV